MNALLLKDYGIRATEKKIRLFFLTILIKKHQV